MKRNQGQGGLLGRLWRGGVVPSLLGLGVTVFVGVAGRHAEESADAVAEGGGGESTVAIAAGVQRLSPIPLANACVLGASSCFKCHNGTRAAKPEMDAAKAPWHLQHAKVNNSCVGCHKGNSRIMKEDIAHATMVAKPRDDTTGSCASCHKGDLAKVQAAYHATEGAK